MARAAAFPSDSTGLGVWRGAEQRGAGERQALNQCSAFVGSRSSCFADKLIKVGISQKSKLYLNCTCKKVWTPKGLFQLGRSGTFCPQSKLYK